MNADVRQTDFCVYLSAILLAGLVLNARFGWWRADSVAALLFASDRCEGRSRRTESTRLLLVFFSIPTPLRATNSLVLAIGKLGSDREDSGDVKGTIPNAVRYHFVPNDVRRHRLISVSYTSLLPCHGTARWHGRELDGIGGNSKEN
jgi:hypothetical protein